MRKRNRNSGGILSKGCAADRKTRRGQRGDDNGGGGGGNRRSATTFAFAIHFDEGGGFAGRHWRGAMAVSRCSRSS